MNSEVEDQILIVDYYSKPLWINSKTFFVSGGLLFDTSGIEICKVDFNKSYRTADLSHNGSRIIMDNTDGIYYMNSDGTGYQKILPNKHKNKNGVIVLYTGSPTWCPDNKHIIYEHFRVTKTEHGEPDGGTLAEGYISFYKLNVDSALAVSNLY